MVVHGRPRVPLGWIIVYWGSFLLVSFQEEPYHLGFILGSPGFRKLPPDPLRGLVWASYFGASFPVRDPGGPSTQLCWHNAPRASIRMALGGPPKYSK